MCWWGEGLSHSDLSWPPPQAHNVRIHLQLNAYNNLHSSIPISSTPKYDTNRDTQVE